MDSRLPRWISIIGIALLTLFLSRPDCNAGSLIQRFKLHKLEAITSREGLMSKDLKVKLPEGIKLKALAERKELESQRANIPVTIQTIEGIKLKAIALKQEIKKHATIEFPSIFTNEGIKLAAVASRIDKKQTPVFHDKKIDCPECSVEILQVLPMRGNNPFNPEDPLTTTETELPASTPAPQPGGGTGGNTGGNTGGPSGGTGGGTGVIKEDYITNGVYTGDGGCGIGSIEVKSNSDTEFIADIPGNGRITFTGDGMGCPFCSYKADNLVIFGIGNHTAIIELTPPNNFYFTATNPQGGYCGELFSK